MGKISIILMLLCVATGVAIFVRSSDVLQDGKDDDKIRFDAGSEHPVAMVEACLFDGKGAEIFDQMQAVAIRSGSQSNDRTYLDGIKARMVLVESEGGTHITFRSALPATGEELDVLDWCATNPELTWIPQNLR